MSSPAQYQDVGALRRYEPAPAVEDGDEILGAPETLARPGSVGPRPGEVVGKADRAARLDLLLPSRRQLSSDVAVGHDQMDLSTTRMLEKLLDLTRPSAGQRFLGEQDSLRGAGAHC